MNVLWLLGLILAVSYVAYAAIRFFRRSRTEAPVDEAPPPEAAPALPIPSSRLTGDVNVEEGSTLPGNMVLTGDLHLSEAAAVDGDAEVHGNVIVRPHARVTGSLVVHGHLVLAEGAATGPAFVNGDVVLHQDAVVNGPLECTTLHVENVEEGEVERVTTFQDAERTDSDELHTPLTRDVP